MEPEKTPRERAEELIRLLVPDWRPTAVQVLWAIRIAVAVAIVLGVLALIGYSFGITLWDWLRLLAVPITIGAAVPLLNWLQRNRELDVEERRAQDEALQAYLDKMTELLVVHGLGECIATVENTSLTDERDERETRKAEAVRNVAWARSKTVLRRLDGYRKGAVLRFLNEAALIKKDCPVIGSLAGADLVGADLEGSYLEGVALKGVVMREAVLRKAILTSADLKEADLTDVDLTDADLTEADLRGVFKYTQEGSKQQITNEELERQTNFLEGATMPDGRKHEKWFNDKEGQGEDEENKRPL